MTLIDRDSLASPDTNTLAKSEQIAGELVAGEVLGVGAACHIDIASGSVFLASNAVAGVAAIHGYSARNVEVNQPVTLYKTMRLRYIDETKYVATPGAEVFLGLTKGTYDDAAQGGTNTDVFQEPVGIILTDRDIFLVADNITDQTPVAVFP